MNSHSARFLLVAAAALLACDAVVEPLQGPPDFAGVVQELRSGAAGQALVVALPDGDAVVHLSGDTRFYRRASTGALRPMDVQSLTPGTRVEVWTTGVELRSLPPQYFGRQVVAP
jgi:hypothetical protein